MKKLALIFMFILIFSISAFSAVGDISGYIYETDIVAKIATMPIPSYNIGGKTVIIAEEMMDYGFKVLWHNENRSVEIFTGRVPENLPEKEITKSSTPGKIAGNIYETDITVQFNGMWVQSYNIGGKTAVVIEDMASNDPNKQFSRDGNAIGDIWNYAGADALWDNEKREIILNVLRPGDLPQKDMWEIKGDYITPVSYYVTGLKFEIQSGNASEDWVNAILVEDKIFIPLSVYEKYKDETTIIYDYVTTRGSSHNNILPLNSEGRESYWYKGEAYIDFTDKLKYKF